MIHTVVICWTTLRIQTMLHCALVFHIVAGTHEINVDITLSILIKAFLLLIFNRQDCYWGTMFRTYQTGCYALGSDECHHRSEWKRDCELHIS
jgi:hypothetical protein